MPEPTKLAARLVLLVVALAVWVPVACSRESPSAAAPNGRPRESILEVLRSPDAFDRARRLAALLPTLGPDSVSEVRQALESPRVDRGAVEIALLVRFWATHDPADASGWALNRSPRSYRVAALVPALETWARADPSAALAWTGTIPAAAGASPEALQVALVRGWFVSGRPGLENYIRNLGPSFERQRALLVFARETIRRDGPRTLMGWAEALPDEPKRFKLAAFRQVASALAQADPAAARAWCDAHCEGPFGSNLRKLVAMRWAASEGQAALEWLAAAPAGGERDIAVRDAFLTWLRGDREMALGWMEARGSAGVEPWLRPAVDLYAVSISGEEPAEALKWATRIDDDARRESAFIAIARRWRAHDESAAEAWLARSPLSEEARERVRAPAARRPRPTRAPLPQPPVP